jgi:hypothetical protein
VYEVKEAIAAGSSIRSRQKRQESGKKKKRKKGADPEQERGKEDGVEEGEESLRREIGKQRQPS